MPRSALLQQLANGLLQARAAASPRVGRSGGGTQGPRAACGFRPAAGRREAGPARLLASRTLWFSFSFSVPELKETWPLGHLRQGSASPGLSLPTPETLAGAGSEAEGGGAVGNGARSPDFWRGATGSPRAVRLRSGVSIHQPLRGGELLPGPSAPRPGRWRGLLLEPQKALEAGATANGAWGPHDLCCPSASGFGHPGRVGGQAVLFQSAWGTGRRRPRTPHQLPTQTGQESRRAGPPLSPSSLAGLPSSSALCPLPPALGTGLVGSHCHRGDPRKEKRTLSSSLGGAIGEAGDAKRCQQGRPRATGQNEENKTLYNVPLKKCISFVQAEQRIAVPPRLSVSTFPMGPGRCGPRRGPALGQRLRGKPQSVLC